MRCLVCGDEFNVIRKLKDLLRVKKYYICDKCLKRYPLDIAINSVPLKFHMLDIVVLFNNEVKINFDGYIEEFSVIYKKILENNENKLVLLYDFLYLNDYFLSEFEHISTLLDKDIIIVTNILRL